ncbi:MAG TPA: prepilin-type N-terminal cleavage/methylation domain-containing protein [Nitrospirota bacterium]|nr:prepilin-type N-terminal cleavage/methylation domain-containing protein [Nitrospirota bacterium]
MRAAPVISNKKGFSLIELMIAVFIIAISMLAMIASMQTAIRINADTNARSTAVRLTNQTAEVLHSLQWAYVGNPQQLLVDAELSVGAHTRAAGNTAQDGKGFPVLTQTIRNFRQDYQIQWTVEDMSTTTKRITITVTYTRPGRQGLDSYSNTSVIFRHVG